MDSTLLTDEEISELTKKELERLNEWRHREFDMPPTTWLGELNPDVVAKAQDAKTKRVILEWLRDEKRIAEDDLVTGGTTIYLGKEDWQEFKKWALGE